MEKMLNVRWLIKTCKRCGEVEKYRHLLWERRDLENPKIFVKHLMNL
jgi:hypothetical protein